MTTPVDREAICQRLAEAFDIKPSSTKHAAHEIAVTAREVDGQEFVSPLTLGEIVDVMTPMLCGEQPQMGALNAEAPKRWVDLIEAAENITDDNRRNEAIKAMLRESNLIEIALNGLIHEARGTLRRSSWTFDDELLAVKQRHG